MNDSDKINQYMNDIDYWALPSQIISNNQALYWTINIAICRSENWAILRITWALPLLLGSNIIPINDNEQYKKMYWALPFWIVNIEQYREQFWALALLLVWERNY